MIPYGRHDISQADIDAVIEVLRSDWLTQGPAVPAFENAVAARCGAAHGVAVNSATSALHIACLALEVGPGDVVWTSPNTFVASANCARYCGASIDFVDIDSNTWCMSVDALGEKLTHAKTAHAPLPKVVIPVHFAGESCNMAMIAKLGKEFGFRIIEDASHAIGGTYKNEPIGCCRYSDITVFSFHPVKIITAGEGGMALTNNASLADRMARLRTHGITRDPARMASLYEGPWYYEQIELGFNYRMTDIQAALGLSQLSRLQEFVSMRNELARRYDEAFAGLPIQCQQIPDGVHSARHLYVIRVPAAERQDLFMHLRARGIGVNLHYIPVHLQPYYRNLGFRRGQFQQAESYYREAISLPLRHNLPTDQQDLVISACREWMNRRTEDNQLKERPIRVAGKDFPGR